MNYSTSTFVLVSCLWLFGGIGLGDQMSAHAESGRRIAEPMPQATDSLLLDQHPSTYAAFSLHKIRSDYSGPAIRVRRGSDDAEQDFGFDGNGGLDVTAIENWLSGANGYVTTWYSQVSGEPALTQGTNSNQPRIAGSGTVFTDSDGRVAIKFDRSRGTHLRQAGSESSFSVNIENTLLGVVGESGQISGDNANSGIVTLSDMGPSSNETLHIQGNTDGSHTIKSSVLGNVHYVGNPLQPGWWGINHRGGNQRVFSNNQHLSDFAINGSHAFWGFTLGVKTGGGSAFDGYISEVALLPAQSTELKVQQVYDSVNKVWNLGPPDYNKSAIMPQKLSWMVDLYDWLETISVSDVTLPDGTIQYDNSWDTLDELADIWLKTHNLTASSVTRRTPEWYVLDDGNGKGIEGTGDVRANHNAKSDTRGYPGNPPRSWQNEPAYLYQLDIPTASGQGNSWYQDTALGLRAMIVSSVDLIMHQGNNESETYDWYDMKGKAFLGMAEAYRWAGDVMPAEAQEAYEQGMENAVDQLTARGPRGVNTNMDMFALKGAAQFYMATNDAQRKQKCVEMVKAALFGYTDGELGSKHRLYAYDNTNAEGGVFHPAGFIMEGGQPDVFYGGESILQITGALAAVTDRSTGDVPSDWQFLEEVVRRLQEWRTYQVFHDPLQNAVGTDNSAPLPTAGGGFNGRTAYGPPNGQGEFWQDLFIGNKWSNEAWKAAGSLPPGNTHMEDDIDQVLSGLDSKMDTRYDSSDPDVWDGWSPWTKPTIYMPPEGWWSNLDNLRSNDDPKMDWPAIRNGETWNKTFGGYPVGDTYWSYKDTDANGNAFGFFVEAHAEQGWYGGWYGGKIETFWTEETGVILVNRHGKTGCDRSGVDDYSGSEDSVCWFNLDEKAGHHVWGRDENGNGFTTLLLKGRNHARTTNFNTNGSPPTVTVNNVFEDSELAGSEGTETAGTLNGSVEVENKFEVQTNGLKVTHTVTSDESDEINMLWASLPVYLRHYNPKRTGQNKQANMEDTRIEHWDGSQWVELPFDTDSDGVPEIINTDALRLMRNYEQGQGERYAYVDLKSNRKVRRAKHKYYDPYQSKTSVRTVHIDMHGDPGTTKTMPASKSVSYTIQTTDPASEEDTSASQVIPLQKGWNITSTSVSPAVPAMDSVFAGLQSEITVVKDEAGERYQPSENINEIGQWNSEKAYLVHAKSDVVLTIQGDSLGSPSVALEKEWNLVPYFPHSPLSIEEAISSITEDLVLVKDEIGRTYLPDKGIEDLNQMEPGEGYKIYVRQPTTLTYPDGGN